MTVPNAPADDLYPVQGGTPYGRGQGQVNESVYMRAYKVYSHCFGAQPAMIDRDGRGCRGGFSKSELVVFLYAGNFPQSEWRDRVDEALRGIQI